MTNSYNSKILKIPFCLSPIIYTNETHVETQMFNYTRWVLGLERNLQAFMTR